MEDIGRRDLCSCGEIIDSLLKNKPHGAEHADGCPAGVIDAVRMKERLDRVIYELTHQHGETTCGKCGKIAVPTRDSNYYRGTMGDPEDAWWCQDCFNKWIADHPTETIVFVRAVQGGPSYVSMMDEIARLRGLPATPADQRFSGPGDTVGMPW